jgi:mRNA interferase YafQ
MFLRNWERLSRAGRYDLNRLKQAMLLLIANNCSLEADWRDHALKGEWAGHRECHIGGDFLLTYKLDDHAAPGHVVFVRAGTHAELFE